MLVALLGVVLAVVGIRLLSPAIDDSVNRDVSFLLALPLATGAFAAMVRGGGWVRLPVSMAAAIAASLAGLEVWASGSALALLILAVALTLLGITLCWPVRAPSTRTRS